MTFLLLVAMLIASIGSLPTWHQRWQVSAVTAYYAVPWGED
jgi:hypothetical protein